MKRKDASLVIGYWQYAPLEDLHQRSRMWLSEITFWREEFAFLRKLINNHFSYFTDKKRANRTLRLGNKVNSMENELNTVENNVSEHESHLKELMMTKSEKLEKQYRQEHRTLEEMLSGFMQDFKVVKRDIFNEADEVLKEEKMQRLISLSG